jgi:hypothetical protein
MKLRKGLSENFCTTLIDVIAGLLAFDATMQCTDPLPQPLTLASSTHGLSLGLRADYGPYRDAFACGLEPRAIPLHRNPDLVPVFSARSNCASVSPSR